MIKSDAQIMNNWIAAKQENKIHKLLIPYYSFRAWFLFKTAMLITEGPKKGQVRKTTHRHGFENICSYEQCIHGHFENILLDKRRGFNECVKMIEEKHKGRFSKAIIYTRSVIPDGVFDIPLREYNHKGEIIPEKNKFELITELTRPEKNQVLYFLIDKNEYLHISETPVPSPNEFRSMVTDSLKS